MNIAEVQTALGTNHNPPAHLVGGFVYGSLTAARGIVQAEDLYHAYHENELPDALDNREAYATVYQYPQTEYVAHVRLNGSPKGYAGPASAGRLVWDIDRANDLESALADTRKLVSALRRRYGAWAEDGLGVYFSGSKGFHVSLVAPYNAVDPRPLVPTVAKRLCMALAQNAGVRVDAAIYDHQRLFRLPNSRHPKTGLYKTFLDLDDLDQLDVTRILELAKEPRGANVPSVKNVKLDCPFAIKLSDDWFMAIPIRPDAVRVPPSHCPVITKEVLDYIGFGDIVGVSRAVMLYRVAAMIAESYTQYGINGVITGLLEEVALKSGLEPAEVRKQIAAGIAKGTGKGATE